MRGKAGLIALLAVGLAAMGLCCARLIQLITEVAPYLGWSWLIVLAGGVVLIVAPIWALAIGLKRWARGAHWLSVGYAAAVIIGARYYLPRRFTPPRIAPGQPLPPPPLWFDLQAAGLLAITAIVVATTLLLVLTAAETIAPGQVKPWLRAILRRPSNPAG